LGFWPDVSVATIDKLEAYLRVRLEARLTPSRHLRHALAIEINFADAFDARQNVIHRLTADAHQFRTYNASHEIARKI
jgi:hypothetical protein